MSGEELYIKGIENGIRAIRLGTKKPNETKALICLNKLKEVNVGLYEDYLDKYNRVVKGYHRRKS